MYLAATFTFMIKVLSFVLKYAKLIIKFENVIILGNHLCENYKQQMGIGQKKKVPMANKLTLLIIYSSF